MKIWAVIKLVVTVWVSFWSVFHDDDFGIFICVSLGELVLLTSPSFVHSWLREGSERYRLSRDTA